MSQAVIMAAFNGLLLGLASTLHCAGMCGAIACSLLLAHERPGGRGPAVAFALNNTGRICAYTAVGAIVGLLGAPAVGWLDREAAFRLLQWAGAAALVGVGLSTAGMMPACGPLARGFARVSDVLARFGGRRGSVSAPVLSGMAWGMMPCAMVYAALFAAMLAGSAAGGAATMLAFGLGTLPGLLAAAFGLRHISGVARSGTGRMAVGLGIALVGMASLLVAHPIAGYLCAPAKAASRNVGPSAAAH